MPVLPRALGAAPDESLQYNPSVEAAIHAFIEALPQSLKPTTQLTKPDGSLAPVAIYAYGDGNGNVFIGADLIRGEREGGDPLEPPTEYDANPGGKTDPSLNQPGSA